MNMRMTSAPMKGLGTFTIFLACLSVLICIATLYAFPTEENSHLTLTVPALVISGIAIVGWGMYRLRKWAALLFSAFTASLGFVFLKLGLQTHDRMPILLGTIFAVLLLYPALITALSWNLLVWRKSET
jgi:hypothetical protein